MAAAVAEMWHQQMVPVQKAFAAASHLHLDFGVVAELPVLLLGEKPKPQRAFAVDILSH